MCIIWLDDDINMLLQHLNYCTQSDTKLSLTKWLRNESFTYIQKAKCVFTRQDLFLFCMNNAYPEPDRTELQQQQVLHAKNLTFISVVLFEIFWGHALHFPWQIHNLKTGIVISVCVT